MARRDLVRWPDAAAPPAPWVWDGRRPPAPSGDAWAGGEAWRTVPTRAPAIDSDVSVPVQQSVYTGWLGFAVFAGLGWLVSADILTAGTAGLVGFVVVAGAAWAWLLWDSRRLLWASEGIARGEAPSGGGPAWLRLQLDWTEKGHIRQSQILNFPKGVDEDRVRQFAAAILAGDKLTVSKWTATGALFTRGEYDAIMGVLVQGGLVAAGHGAAGRALTRPGVHVFKRLAE